MRIANNVVAMNTHRAYTSNNDKVQASAEKLSSGFRINRAGDDAAGLAISEKMRSQIRGLNMATRNSQDAISLIQTAEGALQEVHSMLQRMNELSVQSATGTNEGFDRTQIAKEFEQLKNEINDISRQTTFNNMRILDGSLSYGGPQRSASSSGISAVYEAEKPIMLEAGVEFKGVTKDTGTDFVAGQKAEFEFNLMDLGSPIAPINKDLSVTLKDTVSNESVTKSFDNLSIATNVSPDTVAAMIATALSLQTYKLGSNTYNIEASVTGGGTSIKLVTDKGVDLTGDEIAGFRILFTDGKFANNGSTKTPTLIKEGIAQKNATQAVSTFTFDPEKVRSGDKITVGEKTFTFYDSKKKPDSTGDFDLASIDTAAKFATALGAKFSAAGKDTLDVTEADGTITLKYKGNAGVQENGAAAAAGADSYFGKGGLKYVNVSFEQGDKYAFIGKTTFDIDVSGMQNGDKIIYKNRDGQEITHTFVVGQSAGNIMDKFGIPKENREGSSFWVRAEGDQSKNLRFEAVTDYRQYAPMKIQVGALEGEQLEIKITAMNTTGLKLDESEIRSQETAGKAVTATRAAINAVSDQRALLGAMQNRITHKVANLKISIENLQASESRIRDIDIASEMTTFTKNNILAQAATSMLAQANNMPQSVLSLLR